MRIPQNLCFLYAGTVVSRLGTFVIPYLTIYLSRQRGFDFLETGQIVSVGSLGLFAGNLAGGWLADRWSRKGTLLVALLVNAAGLALLATPSGSGWMYAVQLFGALFGAGMYTPAANTVIADDTDEQSRQFAYTINYVCINLGMGLGPLLGGLLATSGYGWLFAGDIMTTLACFVLIAIGLRPGRSRARRVAPSGSPLRVWRRHPQLLVFCAIGFLFIAPLMGLEYAVPILVVTEFQRPLVFVGLVYTINAGCILVLSFPLERLLRGRDEIRMMVLAGLLWTAGIGVLVAGLSLVALLVSTAIWTVGEIIASIVAPTFVSKRVAPGCKGRMLAVIDAVRSAAGISAPIALGFLWESVGVSAVLFTLCALPAVGTVLYAGALFGRRASIPVLVGPPP